MEIRTKVSISRKPYIMEYRTWYLAMEFSKPLEEEFKKYIIKHKEPTAQYLIVRETSTTGTHKLTKGQHYHFVCEITKKGYTAFARHFIEKYNLKGQSKNGVARQYGMQSIKSKESMCTYLMKDVDTEGNWVATNMTPEDLQRYCDNSYKKYTYESYKFELFHWLKNKEEIRRKTQDYSENLNFQQLIIKFHLGQMKEHDTLKPIKKNNVDSLLDEYEQRFKEIDAYTLWHRWYGKYQ